MNEWLPFSLTTKLTIISTFDCIIIKDSLCTGIGSNDVSINFIHLQLASQRLNVCMKQRYIFKGEVKLLYQPVPTKSSFLLWCRRYWLLHVWSPVSPRIFVTLSNLCYLWVSVDGSFAHGANSKSKPWPLSKRRRAHLMWVTGFELCTFSLSQNALSLAVAA